MKQDLKWWQKSIAYQVYPKSFYDSDGDGIGDLRGIIGKLDYIQELGTDLLYLNPICKSPMKDNGYDVSDYYEIDPMFGTTEDMKELIHEADKRGIHVIMDMVLNHCSDQHEWFQQVLKDPEGEYADYFFLRKGEGENPPNNWRSIFGGSAWEKIPGSEYYYLHLFTKEQVDLNWDNPRLREQIEDMNKQIEKAKQNYDLNKAAELQYGELPKLQQQLSIEEEKVKNEDLEKVSPSPPSIWRKAWSLTRYSPFSRRKTSGLWSARRDTSPLPVRFTSCTLTKFRIKENAVRQIFRLFYSVFVIVRFLQAEAFLPSVDRE